MQTGGDSLLVAFDSIDGAVRCAVKVQEEVPVYDGDQPPERRIRFRIGINIGDVIPHATDLHGDGVNIAARLQAECPVGGVCVSRSVRDHVHGRLDLAFEPMGPLTLKNIARPVEAFVLRLGNAGVTAQAKPGRVPFAVLPTGLVLLAIAAAGWIRFIEITLLVPRNRHRQQTSQSRFKMSGSSMRRYCRSLCCHSPTLAVWMTTPSIASPKT